MTEACTHCDTEFQTVAALTQHLPLHHDTCAVCHETFEGIGALREHVHTAH